MGFTCKRCSESFCSKHRLPENHECAFIDLKKEDLRLKIQLERNQKQTTNQSIAPNKKLYRNKIAFRSSKYDDEYERENYNPKLPFTIDLSINLKIFAFFAIMDVVLMLLYQNPLLIIPMVAHGIFLPIMFILVRKQQQDPYSAVLMSESLKIIILYSFIYFGLKIFISFFIGDFFSAIVYIGLSVFILYRWIKLLQKVNYFL